MPAVIGYWNIRGLAEPIRYLLHYLKADFEDKRYEYGPEPNFMDNEWIRTDKYKLGLDLPNVPYYIDDDVKLSQSLVIIRYLARKNNLYYPNTLDNSPEGIRFEIMEGHINDLLNGFAFAAYNPNFDEYKGWVKTMYTEKIKMVSEFLGNNTWLFGDKISHQEFLLFEALDVLRICFKDILDDFQNIVSFMERFASLPGIEQYRKTSLKWPLFSPYAFWGGKGELPE